jgi:glycosyltransferase involved in cell wall biosynthesis
MNEVFISIVIPIYNKERYIRNTINNILQQTYQNFEIIIINDGSTDNSLPIVQSFIDKRIHIFSQLNSGVSDARNLGIKRAQYSYIAFCDADDEWMPDHLMHITQLIQNYPDAGLLSTGRVCYQNEKEIDKIYFSNISQSMFIVKDICSCMEKVITSSICIKKEAIQKVGGFKSQIKNGEDLDLWIRIASSYKVAYYNIPSVKYIANSINNASQNIDQYFPYWEWYQYNYTPQKSLNIYTGRKIIGLTIKLIQKKKYRNAINALSKLRYSIELTLFYINKHISRN